MSASRSLYHVEDSARESLQPFSEPVLVSLMDARRNLELLTGARPPSSPLRLPYEKNSLTFRFFSGSYAWRRTPLYEFRLHPGGAWSDLDTDHNGSLTKTEASALDSLAQVFDTADTDKDGALTGDEYRAYLKTSGKADTGADATGDSDMDDGGQK